MLRLAVISAVVVVVALGWNLVKRLASDRVQHFVDSRRSSSRLLSHGEFIDGNRHVPVSLALSESAFFYESSDLQASLSLEWIGEVEYEDDLVTGQYVGDGKIMRLRCYGQAFEFLVPTSALQQWQTMLPAHGRVVRAGAPAAGLVAKSELSRADDDGWPTQVAAAS